MVSFNVGEGVAEGVHTEERTGGPEDEWAAAFGGTAAVGDHGRYDSCCLSTSSRPYSLSRRFRVSTPLACRATKLKPSFATFK